MRLKRSQGFTLLELTIAMAIFSVMLLVMTTGVLKLYAIYNAGHEIRNTQEAARAVADQLTRDTHNADYVVVANDPTDPTNLSIVCLFQSVQQEATAMTGWKYYIRVHDPANPNAMSVYRTTGTFPVAGGVPTAGDCAAIPSTGAPITSDAVNMLRFRATSTPAADPRLLSFTLAISAVSGRDRVEAPTMAQPLFHCIPGTNAQYCSVTNLQTSALSRRGSN